ncbi:MAG: energy-coupling factor transporter transmembrane component T [Thermodesulforhabdaceae bacterium]
MRACEDSFSSIIHRLHPFSKLLAGIAISVVALCLKNPFSLCVLLSFVIILLGIAKVRFSRRKILLGILFLSVLTILNLLASKSLSHAAIYSLRFAIFLTAMPVLAATTDPRQMAQALSRTPLPSGLTMALLLVWRFFPAMSREMDQIQKALLLRGNIPGSFVARIYRGFLVPLAFMVIEYTDRITLALELRGFTPSGQRTCYNPVKMGAGDLVFFLISFGVIGLSIWFQRRTI